MNGSSHGNQKIENACARGIQSDVVQHQRRVRDDKRGSDEKYSAGKIAWNDQLASFEFRTRMNAHRFVQAFNRRSEFAQSEFGMVAGANSFAHGGNTFGEKTGQQDGGFHLRARNRQRVIDGMQSAAADFQRSAIIATSA